MSSSSSTPAGPATPTPPQRAGWRQWCGLAVLALPTLLLAVDMSVLFLALPHISADLRPSDTQALWITDVYGFTIAGSLVTAGTLGDRIGHRRLLLTGAAAFGLLSVLAACSTSAGTLIAARALLGVAGATLMPCALALVSTMFREPGQRAAAVAAWSSMFMAGVALGPVLGGMLLEFFRWGSVFLLAVPAMALLLVLGPVLLPEHRDPAPGRLDPLSVALSLAAVLPVVHGFKELASDGGGALSAATIAGGLAAGVVFARRQRNLADPLLDLRLFGDRTFGTALLVLLAGSAVTGGMTLLVTQHLQLVVGLSPLRAGLWLLPSAGALVAGALLSPLLTRRFRPGTVIGGGLLVSAAGYLTLTQVGDATGLAGIVAGFTLAYAGSGPFDALGTDLVVGSAPREKAGAAASMSETVSEVGVALGVAVLGSVATAVQRNQVAGDGSGIAAGTLGPAREALTSGLNTAAAVSAATVAVLAVFAVAVLRRPRSGSG